MNKILVAIILALLAALTAGAQPSYNTVADMLTAVTKPVTFRTGTTLQTLGYDVVRDTGDPLIWSWDATNTLATNRFRLQVGTNTTGRLVHEWSGRVDVFGVKADGLSDDTDAWQAAQDYAATIGKTVILPGQDKTIRITKPIVFTSNYRVTSERGITYVDAQFSGSKGSTNAGAIRTSTALFPTWGESINLTHTNISIENVSLTRNVRAGGSYTGPLLMLDDVDGVYINNLRIAATNHFDWATFLRGNNILASAVTITVPGAWGQDGWHFYGGTNHILNGFNIFAGDDAIAIGNERDQPYENVVVANGIANSDASRGIAIFQATYSTTPPAAPTNKLQYVIIANVVSRSGQRTNWPIVIEEYAGPNNTHTIEPPRLVTDIILDNVLTTRGAHTNGGAGAIRIEGTERVTIANTSVTNGNYAGIWLNRTKNTTLRNVSMFRTVREGSTGGSAGLYAYDNAVNGLFIDGGYYEAAAGLHTILVRGATNISIRGARIVSSSGQYGVWTDRITNLVVSGNMFFGPGSAINVGTANANLDISGNLFDPTIVNTITWDGLNTNAVVENKGTNYLNRLFTDDLFVGTKTAQTNAALAIISTNKGFQPPRMSQTQVDAISSPNLGLLAVDNDNQGLTIHNGTGWRMIPGWPRGVLAVASSGSSTFQILDGVTTPLFSYSSNTWPIVARMYGDSASFGARVMVQRARASGAALLDNDDLGGILFSGTYSANTFADGESGIIGRTTEAWTASTTNGAELVLTATPTNSTTRLELLLINADYGTGQLPLLIRKSDATYKRIGITNVGGNDTLYLIP